MAIDEKVRLRQYMLAARKGLTERECSVYGEAICRRILALPDYQKADRILCYAAVRHEADTWQLIARALRDGKRVALPRVTGPSEMCFYEIQGIDELKKGTMGIPEPPGEGRRAVTEGLMLVPGTAFDRQLYRMGYGGGYYDRWLRQHGASVITCGLAYAFQVLDRIPREAHDQAVDMLVTETGYVRRQR